MKKTQIFIIIVLSLILLLLIVLGLRFEVNNKKDTSKKDNKQDTSEIKSPLQEEIKAYEDLNEFYDKDMNLLYYYVNFPSNNPFVIDSLDDVIKKIENKESLYVYFGNEKSTYSRYTIEQLIKSALDNNIESIYYIDIWQDITETYVSCVDCAAYDVINGNVEKKRDGSDNYYKLLNIFNNYLDEYIVYDNEIAYPTGEKIIYPGDLYYIKDGTVISKSSIDINQYNLADNLTEQQLQEQYSIYNNFFKQTKGS